MASTINRDELIKQFGQVLHKIGLKNIYTDIIRHVPNLNWTDIMQFAVRKKIGITKNEVINFVCAYVTKSKMCDEKKLMELIAIADLLYTAKFSIRKTWYTFKLVKNNSDPIHIHQIKQTLTDTFHHKLIKNQINFYQYDGIVWIQIFIFKPLKREINKNYFAIIPQENFIFSVNKNMNRSVHDALKIALNSRKIIEKPLSGRIIRSLIQMLKNKENKIHDVGMVEDDYTFPDIKSSFTKTDNIYNFVKKSIRNEYANKVIGENPEVLQSLIIKSRKNTINVRQLLNNDKLPESFNIQLKISSPNIMEFVKHLMVNEVIPTPAPSWCTELPYLGTNIINL